MKEKETTICLCATGECHARCELPPCMPHPAKLSPEPAILEDWKNLRSREFIRIEELFKEQQCPVIQLRGPRWERNYKGLWEIANPAPKQTLRDAYNQACARISALEAAIAEKGGAE